MGRGRPKNVLGRSRPKTYSLLGQTRPRRLDWARTRLAQQQNGRGELISPAPLHAEKEIKKHQNRGGRRVTWRGGGGGAVVGGAAAEAGGGGVAHGRRLQAALQLFQTSVSLFFLCFGLLFFFSSLSFLSLFFFPLFFFYVFLSSWFLSSFGSSSLSPLFFFCFSPSSLPSVLFSFFLFSPQRSWALFIEAKGAVFLQLSRGAAGWSAIGGGCRGSVGGARWVVGHYVRSVGSRREWQAKIQKKATLFPFFPAA